MNTDFITEARIFLLTIPLRSAFSHHLHRRVYSESLIVQLLTNNGLSGFGEGAPRVYVTGETLQSAALHLSSKLGKYLLELSGIYAQFLEIKNKGFSHTDYLPSTRMWEWFRCQEEGVNARNAAKSALETAYLDLLLRASQQPAASILPPIRESVVYSGVIGASDLETVKGLAQRCHRHGLRQIKVKVREKEDVDKLRMVRDIVGAEVSLRVDANGAFDAKTALEFLKEVEALNLSAIEQPVPRDRFADMVQVTASSPIPVIADESLVTIEDAEQLIESRGCSMFNLRISKNGGVLATLALAELAQKNHVGIQLGCQVGESSILSAVGRHVAFSLPNLEFLEGSFGTLLLEDDVVSCPILFGEHGVGEPLRGMGWGVEVEETALYRQSAEVHRIGLNKVPLA